MTRYLVTDTYIRSAINEAISEQDIDRPGPNYVIKNTQDVVNHVLRLLDKFKVAEAEQTATPKQDSRNEIDTSEYPFIQLRSNELVEMICSAYQKGTEY